jgi:hypothetical protein
LKGQLETQPELRADIPQSGNAKEMYSLCHGRMREYLTCRILLKRKNIGSEDRTLDSVAPSGEAAISTNLPVPVEQYYTNDQLGADCVVLTGDGHVERLPLYFKEGFVGFWQYVLNAHSTWR